MRTFKGERVTPRNGSGTYSLPQPAFVSGTKISSSAVNSDFSDIAAALTQSVSSDGQTPLTGAIKFLNGTVGAPGIVFVGDTTSGFYLNAAGQIGLALGGVQAALFTSSGVTWTPAQTFQNSITFNGTGFTFGAGAAAGFWQGLASTFAIGLIIDGEGSNIVAGHYGSIQMPCNITIKAWSIIANASGSITIDVDAAGAPPSYTGPGASITGGNPPALSSAWSATSSTLTGWTTSIGSGSVIDFNVTGTPTVTRATISLLVERVSSS